MPLAHERSFTVRHYECDAYGHVNHANYLRYMQEAAYDASAAAGYDMHTLFRMNRVWLVRDTDITYHRPLQYGDTVCVRTWVDDFRRVRSRRLYQLRLADSDEQIATAWTDWVYLARDTHRPMSIPDEMMTAFFPEGPPEQGQRRDRFPEPPPPPPGVFAIRRTVEWRDLDPAQHVNNANYLAFLEECGVRLCAAFNWPVARLAAANLGMLVRNYRIEYIHQAVMGDELEIATWASAPRRATAHRHYTITRVADGALLARARAQWVWVALDTGQPRRIPDAFLADFRPNIVE